MQDYSFSKDKAIHLLSSDIVDIWGILGKPRKGHVLLHSEWKGPFTPSRYKLVLGWLEQIKRALDVPDLSYFSTIVNANNDKAIKYVSLFGFKPDGAVLDEDGNSFVEFRTRIR